jgi:hypothetical protein
MEGIFIKSEKNQFNSWDGEKRKTTQGPKDSKRKKKNTMDTKGNYGGGFIV